MVDDRYLAELKALTKNTVEDNILDRVKKYTHDITGKKLPCAFVQLNEQVVFHLNKIPKHIEAKNDYFALCFGYPGAGKTHAVMRCCTYLNAEFSLKDIVFTVPQLEEWISHAPIGSVGLFDEADAIAGGYYDEVLRSLIRNMQRIRTKRLVLFFNTPTMRDMNNYFAFRAKMVLYCFVPKNTNPSNRGYLHMWHDQDLIADLFARMKKSYSETSRVYDSAYSTLKHKYIGRDIPDDWHIDEKAYEKKKEQARKDLEKAGGLTPKAAVSEFRKDVIIRLDKWANHLQCKQCKEVLSPSKSDLAKLVDLKRHRFSEILNEEGSI